MSGFRFEYYLGGGDTPQYIELTMKNGVSIDAGEAVELESGEADYGVSGSTGLIGVAAESVDNAADGESIRIIPADNAVFSVVDATARAFGASLDINATYDGLTTSSNKDVVCVKEKAATKRTFFMFNIKKLAHYNV